MFSFKLDKGIPLRQVEGDAPMIYVGDTRVPLETVILTFNRGATPEEIVMQYPALSLSDVYLVIGYYLQHRAAVDAYIEGAEAHAERVRNENEARFDTAALRERLLARQQDES